MKILHTVQRYAPDTGGSEEVVKQISEYLVSWGHDVTVAVKSTPRRSFKELNGVKVAEFNCEGNSIEGIKGDTEAYVGFVDAFDGDIMMNYAAQIWSSDLVFDLLPSMRMKKVFVPCGYSRLNDPLFSGYFKKLPDILRQYDKVVYLSDDYIDTAFGRQHGLKNGMVIPNGADLREFDKSRRGRFRKKFGLGDSKIILNVSNHSTLKGHRFFWSGIHQLRDLNVAPVLIGNPYVSWWKKWLKECYIECRVSAMREHALLLEGLPRDGVVDAYIDADVFLFGSKVECSPLVMFESFASKTMFVTTDCGNVKDYRDVVCIVKSVEEAVESIRDYCVNPARYADRIDQGYQLFLRSLNWEAIAKRYESLYLELISRNN